MGQEGVPPPRKYIRWQEWRAGRKKNKYVTIRDRDHCTRLDLRHIIILETDIAEMVRGLRGGRAGGPLEMKAEDLKGCP